VPAQHNEAGGITQQIGASFVAAEAIALRTASVRAAIAEREAKAGGKVADKTSEAAGQPDLTKLPGLLVIDTPGRTRQPLPPHPCS
jgi:translation initiation factor IF-2